MPLKHPSRRPNRKCSTRHHYNTRWKRHTASHSLTPRTHRPRLPCWTLSPRTRHTRPTCRPTRPLHHRRNRKPHRSAHAQVALLKCLRIAARKLLLPQSALGLSIARDGYFCKFTFPAAIAVEREEAWLCVCKAKAVRLRALEQCKWDAAALDTLGSHGWHFGGKASVNTRKE